MGIAQYYGKWIPKAKANDDDGEDIKFIEIIDYEDGETLKRRDGETITIEELNENYTNDLSSVVDDPYFSMDLAGAIPPELLGEIKREPEPEPAQQVVETKPQTKQEMMFGKPKEPLYQAPKVQIPTDPKTTMVISAMELSKASDAITDVEITLNLSLDFDIKAIIMGTKMLGMSGEELGKVFIDTGVIRDSIDIEQIVQQIIENTLGTSINKEEE